MPNWGAGNSKVIDARQRKNAAKLDAKEAEIRAKEEAKWKDEVTQSKLNKKEETLSKLQEKQQKKAELRNLAAQEEGPELPSKLTRAQIQQRTLLSALNAQKAAEEEEISVFDMPNPNRLRAEEELKAKEIGQDYISASSIGEALDKMLPTEQDRFPTKRMKAAYAAYEEQQLAQLKKEEPGLKRSQMKERIFKQWQKAPENPLNQI